MSFKDWLSLVVPAYRYSRGYARARGAMDGGLSLPPDEPVPTIAARVMDNPDTVASLRTKRSDVPVDERAAFVKWLEDRQLYFVGYLSELRNLAEELICDIRRTYHERDATLKARQCTVESRRVEAEEDAREFERLYPRYRGGSSLGRWIYGVAVLVVLLGEIPLNQVAFRRFGEAEVFNLAVALVIGFAIAILAHWVGGLFRQPMRTRIDFVMLAVTLVVFFGSILGIGLTRQTYLESIGAVPRGDFTGSLVFLALQTFLFVIAAGASYASHNVLDDVASKLERLRSQEGVLRTRREKLAAYHRNEARLNVAYINKLHGEYAAENRLNDGPVDERIKDIGVAFPTDLEPDFACPTLEPARQGSAQEA